MELGSITTAVQGLSVASERASLVDLCRLGDLLEVKRLAALGAYEAAGFHEIDGHKTLAAWLRAEAERDPTTAGRDASRARKLHRLPDLVAAVLDGRVSGGQLEVILARVPRRHLDRFVEHCPGMLQRFEWLDVAGTVVMMDRWRQLADAEDPRPEPKDCDSEVFLSRTLDGRGDQTATSTRTSTPCSTRHCGSRTPRTSTCRRPSGAPPPSVRSARGSWTARPRTPAAGTVPTSTW